MSAFSAAVTAPSIDWGALLPLLILAGGAIATLLVSMLPGRAVQRGLTPLFSAATLIGAGAAFALALGSPQRGLVSGSISIDDLSCVFGLIFVTGALGAVALSWGSETLSKFGRGEFHTLLITSVLGMSLLASAENLVMIFLSLELFSIPLYVLCAGDLRRSGSLEAGVKYLIIGSLGSATLLFGLALVYGATGSTEFAQIARALSAKALTGDPLLLAGVALTFVGFSFKASIAPFHQWTPDVYQGAPTPVTAFMAVATKAAAFAMLLRFCGEAIAPLAGQWETPLAALSVITIIVGNLGAIGQDSLKRMLAYSGVAQAGYLLIGDPLADFVGARATIFYLLVYVLMNIAPFAVITARERAGAGEGYDSLRGLGREAPALAWSMTIAMLALAGLPITAGFIGKILLILGTFDGGQAWLAVMIVLGSAMSLVYYLRVIATMWMPAPASSRTVAGSPIPVGAAPEADPGSHPELVAIAVIAAAGCIVFGVWPDPLLDLAREAAQAIFP